LFFSQRINCAFLTHPRLLRKPRVSGLSLLSEVPAAHCQRSAADVVFIACVCNQTSLPGAVYLAFTLSTFFDRAATILVNMLDTALPLMTDEPQAEAYRMVNALLNSRGDGLRILSVRVFTVALICCVYFIFGLDTISLLSRVRAKVLIRKLLRAPIIMSL